MTTLRIVKRTNLLAAQVFAYFVDNDKVVLPTPSTKSVFLHMLGEYILYDSAVLTALTDWSLTTIAGTTAIALTDSITGFVISLNQIELMLNLDGDPSELDTPTNLVSKAFLIKYLFENRVNRTARVSNTGDVTW